MPELPEVQTIVTVLNEKIAGYKIKKVETLGPFQVFPSRETFRQELEGTIITQIQRVAKNIVFNLDSNNYLVIHLAMTGQILFQKTGEPKPTHTRVVFTITKNDKKIDLNYLDTRMFGKVELLTEKEFQALTAKYGPEPLDKTLTPEHFLKSLQTKKTTIKNILLDQSVIAGVGNIYATDALFMAGINPKTSTKELTLKAATKLLAALRAILTESIEHRGSTLSDKMYVDPFGRHGKHQHYFRVYGKRICAICNGEVVYEKVNGRGTYFCPKCQ